MTLISFLLSAISQVSSALIVFLIGLIAGRILGRIVTLALLAYDADKHLRRIGGASAAFFFGSVISYVVYFYSAFLALRVFGIESITAVVIAIILILLLLAGAILGARDFYENLFAYYTARQNLKVGDAIIFDGLRGRVTQRDHQKVKVITREGDVIVLPNAGLSSIKIKKA